jgi:PadR family transcriptional regulator PadR
MAPPAPKDALLQGTLDMLVLRTVQRLGRAHGHDVARSIHATTREVLRLEHGSLYPALHRLERRRLIVGRWERHPERNRDFKYYRLTAQGRRHLGLEASRWTRLAEAVRLVMQPGHGEEV